MRCAVFPCLGLGDGLLSLILSYNLALEGHQVDTFHPFLGQMQPLFPATPLLPRGEKLTIDLAQYDKLFIFYEKSDWMQEVLGQACQYHREKTYVLNPIATPLRDYPYWAEGEFDGTVPLGDNLVAFCAKKLGMKAPRKTNGIVLAQEKLQEKHSSRVLIHPTSSRAGKNWARSKYLRLAQAMAKRGFEPVFILSPEEQALWPEVKAPYFANLIELTYFVAASGFMVGNDSGIGHLASCVGVPTLTICRSQMTADFWRPCFASGEVIVPPRWIPNLKGLRWRDKKWQHFVPVSQVMQRFLVSAVNTNTHIK